MASEAASGLVVRTITSPVGDLPMVASARGLVAILWAQDAPGQDKPDQDKPERVRLGAVEPDRGGNPHLRDAESQLADYFAGRRRDFDVALDPRGTAFQCRVWDALRTIPFGETRTYRDIAIAIGRPTATRAVGAANGRNPISIIVPCHRVVGANGSLTGFAGGLAVKRHLLAHEGSRLC